MSEPERTPDGHHVIINGRRWRASDPNLSERRRAELVGQLMAARRDVGAAKRAGDEQALASARQRVNAAKVGLGERGPAWWEENADSGDATAEPDAVAFPGFVGLGTASRADAGGQ